jgi:hypothetical protein
MSLVVTLLMLICLIVLGVAHGKPLGYIVIGLSVLALLLVLLGGLNVSIGR